MSDALEIGTLSGRIELEDGLTSKVDLMVAKIDQLDGRFGGLGGRLAETTASFFGAEVAIEAVKAAGDLLLHTLEEITIEGSHAADIEDTFVHLSGGSQEASGKLTILRDGVRGTVTDLDLMRRANQNMAAGLSLTAGQMKTMTDGAFALSKMTGGDVSESLDKMSAAMVTGRVRGVQMLTGKIDLAAAEQVYADKLDTTTDHLTTQGKQAAIQEAILDRVAAATARVGEQHVRLADNVKQGEVVWANFEEEIGTAVATSPVIAAGFDMIRQAITNSFGGDQPRMIHAVADVVDSVAIKIVGFAGFVADAVGVIGTVWNEGLRVFYSVEAGWDAIGYAGEGALLGIMKALNVISFGAFDEDVKLLTKDVEGWYDAMAINSKAIDDSGKAQDDWAVRTGKVKDVLDQVQKKMISARDANANWTEVIRDGAKAADEATTSTTNHGAAETKTAMTMELTAEQTKKMNQAWKDLTSAGDTWQDTLTTIDAGTVQTITYYLQAGQSIGKLKEAYPLLTEAQLAAIESSVKAGKVEADIAASLGDKYRDYYTKKANLEGTTTAKAINDSEKQYEVEVENLQKKGVADVQYYNQLWDLRNKNISLDDEQRLTGDSKSKASLLQRLADAQDYYQFMLDHSDQYHAADIKNQKDTLDMLKKQRDAWYDVAGGVDADTAKVKLLDGEILSVADALKRFNAGSTNDYDLSTIQGVEQWRAANPGDYLTYSDQQVVDFIKAGGTLAQLFQMGVAGGGAKNGVKGTLPSFDVGGPTGEGGLAMLHAGEFVVPAGGALVSGATGGSVDVQNNTKAIGGLTLAVTALVPAIVHGFDVLQTMNAASLYELSKAADVTGFLANSLSQRSTGSIPQFKDGGIGDFGEGTLAMLHGPEAVVPLGSGGFGSTVINAEINVQGVWDPATLRQMKNGVSEQLLSDSGRKF